MSDSARLRDAAAGLRSIASRMDDKPMQVKRDYPPGKIWAGPAADEFYRTLNRNINALGDVIDALNRYATTLDNKAADLDKDDKAAANN